MNRYDYYILVLFNIKMSHLGNNTDPGWLDYRLDLFQRYTLRSLINQTDGIFRIWMICLRESESILAPKVEMMKKNDPAMTVVDFVFDESLACSALKNNIRSLYFLKLDSDDMYRKDTIKRTKELLGYSDKISLAMFCNGFIYNIKATTIHTFSRWSITTYAVFYPPKTFDHNSFRKYCICDQTKVRKRFRPLINMDNMVCLIDHDMNLHNDPRRHGVEIKKRTGQFDSLPKNKTKEILVNFGIVG